MSTAGNWLEFINDEQLKLAIPVGPRFQADIPDWTGPPRKCYGANDESYALKWLGTRVWPLGGRRSDTKRCVIGKGRPDSCSCASPGSIGCVKRHITDKRLQLQFDLGPAFWKWRFNDMGEDVSKSWNLDEQKNFDALVKMNPVLQGKSFLNPALERLPSHSRENIVNYYFNVYVPRRMSIETRAGCKNVDTDDDEANEALCSKISRKRYRADSDTSSSSKYLKDRYLTGRR
ncbi:AT-rich interactive domain-containing protein 2-like isoform X4 [Diospyros lotus]|nr:AT-rich interactive domain-containing protein 2-like isoform X4 [Diospyros lotus]XP_052187914.1 AT-rich interactive domain-containing protein 2-like isoform X4 [Diospyros lotus]XP_052187915.1 AT-rich interactive domain-containing protein 2-like isoform X4 [Diospyros lotus]